MTLSETIFGTPDSVLFSGGKTVSVLGTPYSIVLLDLKTCDDWKDEPEERIRANMKMVLRHEIIHAFFNESGLRDNSGVFDGAWAQYEGMVDWWAIQGPKVYAAWKEADAI